MTGCIDDRRCVQMSANASSKLNRRHTLCRMAAFAGSLINALSLGQVLTTNANARDYRVSAQGDDSGDATEAAPLEDDRQGQ